VKNVTLGIDLGTNSLGWSLIQYTDQEPDNLKDCGVRIFQEAVEDKTRTPKNQARRQARSARKLISRRKMRRQYLLKLLQGNKLLPENKAELEEFFAEKDPYEIRKKGLDEQLTAYEFGRAIYHLDQRRGFKSNRKTDKKDTKETGKVKAGISELQENITASECRTLGEYLADQKTQRGRYTDRQMYLHEFRTLWEIQQKYHPDLLTKELKEKIENAIFFQRPLKIQKHLVGKCTFEPTRPRAAKAALAFQQFRILQDINNLTVSDPITYKERPLYKDERQIMIIKLNNQKTLTWKAARKALDLHEGELFNLERGGKKELIGNRTACDITKVIGKPRWDAMSFEERDSLVTDILTIESEKGFLRRMKEHWLFSEEIADNLNAIELEPGYANLSLKAIRKILPELEQGLIYDKACAAAGYDHSQPLKNKSANERLDVPNDMRNPVVQKALWETRKVVNAIIKKHGKPKTIRIEMAREMKLSKKRKDEIQKNQNKQRDENERIREILRTDFGFQQPERDDILKYKLWEECNMTCPYTGKAISREMLFTQEVDIEHILPYSQSLDDSYMNKTLCIASENRQVKRNRSPYEAYHSNEEKYQEMILRINKEHMPKMPWQKRRKFMQDKIDTDEFIARQLNDTQYICTEVKKYLQQLGVEVDVSKGVATASLRKKWDLNKILPPPKTVTKGKYEEKVRTDHRHHAIDAVVIALTTRGLFQNISRYSDNQISSYGLSNDRFKVDQPWNNFDQDIRQAVDNIIISHAPLRKIHGALHEDTAYGFACESGKKDKLTMVYRVRLESITANQIKNIRDAGVKKLVEDRLAEFYGEIKDAFGNADNPLYHKDGKTPIVSVRVLTDMSASSVFGIEEDQDEPYKYFKYGSNHHVEIIENRKTGKREGRFITMMEAAKRPALIKYPS
jgi:CRISPR-associated endonuclease Csn1